MLYTRRTERRRLRALRGALSDPRAVRKGSHSHSAGATMVVVPPLTVHCVPSTPAARALSISAFLDLRCSTRVSFRTLRAKSISSWTSWLSDVRFFTSIDGVRLIVASTSSSRLVPETAVDIAEIAFSSLMCVLTANSTGVRPMSLVASVCALASSNICTTSRLMPRHACLSQAKSILKARWSGVRPLNSEARLMPLDRTPILASAAADKARIRAAPVTLVRKFTSAFASSITRVNSTGSQNRLPMNRIAPCIGVRPS
mmetsp:Transcript_69840/g.214188  ORF Transcript_69840/g.214188 Transcript_69840/m.214188 type:complete len:258 (-) Transcript_69840:2104-2877(-)